MSLSFNEQYRLDRIKRLAKAYKWVENKRLVKPRLISFIREEGSIVIYYGTMTVATTIEHPRHRPQTLYRRLVDYRLLSAILAKPRIHTGKGYYTRRSYVRRYKRLCISNLTQKRPKKVQNRGLGLHKAPKRAYPPLSSSLT